MRNEPLLRFIIFVIIIAGLFGGYRYFSSYYVPTPTPRANTPGTGGQYACTMEAKICPDGTAVGRAGPYCEFARCPGEPGGNNIQTSAIIKGTVTVGPNCPVQQQGVPCPTPPQAYTSREVLLYALDGRTLLQRMYFTPTGTYSFSVPPGTYVVDIPRQGIGGSSDLPKTVTLQPGQTAIINFSIDTGIR